jgi:hypothetical protein
MLAVEDRRPRGVVLVSLAAARVRLAVLKVSASHSDAFAARTLAKPSVVKLAGDSQAPEYASSEVHMNNVIADCGQRKVKHG